jgi:hypothetical protein
MALTLENINLVKQRTRWEVRTPGAMEALRSLWKHMEQKGNPDLQFVAFERNGTDDNVIADAACRIYAIYFKKPATSTTAAWLKGSDHAATAAAAGDVVINLEAAAASLKEACPVFHDGLSMSTGFTMACHTAVDSNTDSAAADSPAGFVILGAA